MSNPKFTPELYEEMYEMLASIRATLEYMGYLPYLVKDIDLILCKARGESEVSE